MEDNKRLELKGVHGTCRSSAESIVRNGFRTAVGRHGTGVYIWSSNNDDQSYAIELAICYANDMPHLFNGKVDKEVVALICDVLTTEDSFLDLDEDSKSRMLNEYIRKHTHYLATAPKRERKKRTAKVLDDFVKLLEETSGLSFDVIHTKTQAPSSYRQKLSQAERWLNMEKQGCYIIRNLDCIPRDRIKAA